MATISNELLLNFIPQVNAGEGVDVLNPRDIGIVDGLMYIVGKKPDGARVRVPVVCDDYGPENPVYDPRNGVCYMSFALK